MPVDKYTKPNWHSSALLTIDMQEDFSRPGAVAYIPGTDEILPPLQKLVRNFRDLGRPLFHAIRLYLRDGANVDLCRRSSVEQGTPIVAPGSTGAELVEELKPNPSFPLSHKQLLKGKKQQLGSNEWVFYKPRWGAFYGTNLETWLHDHEINTVIIAGCNFPNCPRATLYEASERDFRLVIAGDAISGLYSKGEKELEGIGVSVFESTDILKNLQ